MWKGKGGEGWRRVGSEWEGMAWEGRDGEGEGVNGRGGREGWRRGGSEWEGREGREEGMEKGRE